MICSGVDSSYKGDRELVGNVEGSSKCYVSHVEGYSARPSSNNFAEDSESAYDYEQALAWGKEAVEDGHMYVGVPGGSAGGKFAYDYCLDDSTCLQLIIGEPEVTDAWRLLDSFDLEICKCSFDGSRFRVPAPGNTFAGRTAFMPQQRAVVADFMRHANMTRGKKSKTRTGMRLTKRWLYS